MIKDQLRELRVRLDQMEQVALVIPTEYWLDALKEPTLGEEVYHPALERIEALGGCTEDSPEERELIDWATLADAYERSVGLVKCSSQHLIGQTVSLG